MKKMRFLITVIVFSLVASSSFGQGKFGKDSANCVNYLNFYRDNFKQGNLKEAAPLWQKAIKSCPPTASQQMLIDGQKILRFLMDKYPANSPERAKYVDSILLIHDLRAQYYPKYAYKAKENKAFDMLTLLKGEDKKVLDVLLDVAEMGGDNTNISILVSIMDKAKNLYQAKQMSADEVLSIYAKYAQSVEAILAGDPSDNNKAAQLAFENFFITSGVATCDNLVAVFTPRYEANKEDKDVVKTIVKVLSDAECLQTDLFLKSVVSLHTLEPSYNSAYFLYKLYASKDDNEKAIKFLHEAIDSPESDNIKDSEMLLELATYTFKNQGSSAKAYAWAKEAAEKNSALSAKANFLIATIWANQRCGGNEIESRAKYWVAVDYLVKAKAQDPTMAQEADKLISGYRQYFPKVEEAFMYDIIEGSSYTVSCGGMSATTTVRTIK